MQFRYDERKATAVAAMIVQASGGAEDMLRLVKLLYLSERKALESLGAPIFGDRYFSMEHGPVPSAVYDALKPGPMRSSAYLARHLSRDHGTKIGVVSDPGTGALSPAEIEVVRLVCAEHESKNTWELVEWVHTLPEWEDPGKSSIPIDNERLLRRLGRSLAQIERLREEEDAALELDSLLAETRD